MQDDLKLPFEKPFEETVNIYRIRFYRFTEVLLLSSISFIFFMLIIYSNVFFAWSLIIAVIYSFKKNFRFFDYKEEKKKAVSQYVEKANIATLFQKLDNKQKSELLKNIAEYYSNNPQSDSIFREKPKKETKEPIAKSDSLDNLDFMQLISDKVTSNTPNIW